MKHREAEYHIFQRAAEMWESMGNRWADISSDAVRERGDFMVALSGGKTPIGFYQHLASLAGLPWNRTHIFFADERFVPHSDPESNYRMVRETLLERVHPAPPLVHAISTAQESPDISARRYEEDLRIFFELQPGSVPVFDLILLGIGEDGHTASLFPGSAVLKERSRLAAAVKPGRSLRDRITLTLPVINNARNVYFLVSGKNKSSILKRVIDEKDPALPASMVRPEKGRLFFIMDKEARGE